MCTYNHGLANKKDLEYGVSNFKKSKRTTVMHPSRSLHLEKKSNSVYTTAEFFRISRKSI
jgi:hypothetical protein